MMARTITTQKNEKIKLLWIGLVSVIPNPGNDCFGVAKGAFVNVITFATNAKSFTRRVRRALNEMDLTLIETEEVEPLRKRLSNKNADVDKELSQMAETAERLDSVAFGTFFTYSDDEGE